jgi:hypothetical protein
MVGCCGVVPVLVGGVGLWWDLCGGNGGDLCGGGLSGGNGGDLCGGDLCDGDLCDGDPSDLLMW